MKQIDVVFQTDFSLQFIWKKPRVFFVTHICTEEGYINNAHVEFVSLIVHEQLLKQEWKVKLQYFSKENSQYFNSAYLREIWDLTRAPLIYT